MSSWEQLRDVLEQTRRSEENNLASDRDDISIRMTLAKIDASVTEARLPGLEHEGFRHALGDGRIPREQSASTLRRRIKEMMHRTFVRPSLSFIRSLCRRTPSRLSHHRRRFAEWTRRKQ